MKLLSLISAILAFVFAGTKPAAATTYLFTQVAEPSPDNRTTEFGPPVINNAGAVAFYSSALTERGVSAIYRWDAGTLTTIARDREVDPVTYSSLGNPAINDAGTVAFVAGLAPQGSNSFELLTGTGGPLTVVAGAAGALDPGSYSNMDSAAINNAGTVAFYGSHPQGRAGIITVTADGVVTSTYPNNDPLYTIEDSVSMNSAGTVAFAANLGGHKAGIGALAAGGAITVLENTSDGVFFEFGNPVINEAGTLAFFAERTDGNGIFTTTNGVINTVVDSAASSIEKVGNCSINASGTVAFSGFSDLSQGNPRGVSSIYITPDASNNRVLTTGDALFGSTVVQVGIGSASLNDRGQIAFSYLLADGRYGIGLATSAYPDSVRVTAAQGNRKATFTITNTGQATTTFRLKKRNDVTNAYKGPHDPASNNPSLVSYALAGADITEALSNGKARVTLAAGASTKVVVTARTRVKNVFTRTIRTMLTASSGATSDSASTVITLKASRK